MQQNKYLIILIAVVFLLLGLAEGKLRPKSKGKNSDKDGKEGNSKSCGESTNKKETHFTHSGYVASTSTSVNDEIVTCDLTIFKNSDGIGQLRLDFELFTTKQPDTNGNCIQDQFIISGSPSPIPVICGVNTGQHMYVDMDTAPVILSVNTSGPLYSRSWRIKITQIKFPSTDHAPKGCLQYYSGLRGEISSFNFGFIEGQQLSNQDYAVCINQSNGYCGVSYTACVDNVTLPDGSVPGRSKAFTLNGQLSNPGTGKGALAGSSNCNTDWITIPCATNTEQATQSNGGICQDRLCGDVFNSEGLGTTNEGSVNSYVRPFTITYHSDSNELNDSENRGFCLLYTLLLCTH